MRVASITPILEAPFELKALGLCEIEVFAINQSAVELVAAARARLTYCRVLRELHDHPRETYEGQSPYMGLVRAS